MAKENTKTQGGTSAEDKALERFADLMIERISSIQSDWKKPWFSEAAAQWPKNLSGREYNGMNALMLTLEAEKKGYQIPIWATFDRINHMNFAQDKEGKWNYNKDSEGNKMPHVGVKSGEKGFPVFITVFSVVDTETKQRVKYNDYKQMTEEQRAKYKVFPKLQVYTVFNLAGQTNLKEARPELYAKLEEQNSVKRPELNGEQFSFEPVDKMIKDNLWVCPINEVHGDDAYYSISKREIVIPERGQFYDGESFYSNLFHEMAHSTGAEGLLNRLSSNNYGSAQYAREELVAELSAAVTASRYNMTKNIKSDSAAYLKNWLESIHEDPAFLKTTLMDVKRASGMINQRVDKIQLALSEGREINRSEFETKTMHNSNSESVIDEKAAAKALSAGRHNSHPESVAESNVEEQHIEESAKYGRGR